MTDHDRYTRGLALLEQVQGSDAARAAGDVPVPDVGTLALSDAVEAHRRMSEGYGPRLVLAP